MNRKRKHLKDKINDFQTDRAKMLETCIEVKVNIGKIITLELTL